MGECPKYMVDDIMALSDQFDFKPGIRNMIGEKNLLMPGSVMQKDLVNNLNFLLNYIISQHYPILKDKIIYEKTICRSGARVDSYDFPKLRYVYRVGETIMVPLSGTGTIKSEEFPSDTTEFKIGNMYRVNTRCAAQIVSSDDFIVANFTLVDFDMYKYLMPHDMHGYFPRRKDEMFDYVHGTLVAEEETERNAY